MQSLDSPVGRRIHERDIIEHPSRGTDNIQATILHIYSRLVAAQSIIFQQRYSYYLNVYNVARELRNIHPALGHDLLYLALSA